MTLGEQPGGGLGRRGSGDGRSWGCGRVAWCDRGVTGRLCWWPVGQKMVAAAAKGTQSHVRQQNKHVQKKEGEKTNHACRT